MLSRKQLWRRAPASKPFSPTNQIHNQSLYNTLLFPKDHNHSTVSDDTDLESNSTSQGSLKRFLSLRSCISSADLRKLDPIIQKQKKSRRVRFSSYVKVCLIPTRDELVHLNSDLYWNLEECETFKKDGVEQLKRFSKHHGIAMKDAISLLFQPTKSGEVDYTEDLVRDCVYSHKVESHSSASILKPNFLPNDSIKFVSARLPPKTNTDKQIPASSRSSCQVSDACDNDNDDIAATTSSLGDDDEEDYSDSDGSDDSLFVTGKTDIDLNLNGGIRTPHVTHSSARQQIAWEVTWTPNDNPSAVRLL